MRLRLLLYLLLIPLTVYQQDKKDLWIDINVPGTPIFYKQPASSEPYKMNRMAGVELSFDTKSLRPVSSTRKRSFIFGAGIYYETRFLKSMPNDKDLSGPYDKWGSAKYNGGLLHINNEYVSFSGFLERKYRLDKKHHLSFRFQYYRMILQSSSSYTLSYFEERSHPDLHPDGTWYWVYSSRTYSEDRSYSHKMHSFMFGVKYGWQFSHQFRLEIMPFFRGYESDISTTLSCGALTGITWSLGKKKEN